MLNQYADSDSRVKAKVIGRFRTASEDRATIPEMGAEKPVKEPEPVSEFIRTLIERWESDGKLLKDLAKEAGMAKSMPSQIKARTSDATLYSARKLAGPLGFADLPDLVNAAWIWWHSEDRTSIPGSSAEAPLTEALRLAEKYGLTNEQIQRALKRWPAAENGDKDTLWWLSRFHEERSVDAQRAGQARAEKSAAASDARVVKQAQSDIREVSEAIKAKRDRTTAKRRATIASRKVS